MTIDTKQRATDFYLSWLRDNPLSAPEDFGEMLENYRAAFAPDADAVQEKAEALVAACVKGNRLDGGGAHPWSAVVELREALNEDTMIACKYCGFTAGDAEKEFQAVADARGVLDNVCGILFGDTDTTYDSLDDPPFELCARAQELVADSESVRRSR